MNSTARRVPRIMGFPTKISGSRVMRDCRSIGELKVGVSLTLQDLPLIVS
jgi:hypothetical protein